jgi:glycosyltransferase involved in cell wall biosynthesis
MNNSLGQIVHMQSAKEDLETQYENANVHVVHMGVVDPWAHRMFRNARVIRRQYGFTPSTFLIGIFGSVIPVKRIESCLRAMHCFRETHPDCLMLIVGNPFDPLYIGKLKELVTELHLESHVRFYGHAPRTDFDNLFLASDVVLNLRYPSMKGMSAILIRALAAGKPILISDIPEWSDLPQEFCLRVKPDEKEVETITHYLVTISKDPELKKELSQKARTYFEQHGTLLHMAAQYFKVIEEVLAQEQLPRAR